MPESRYTPDSSRQTRGRPLRRLLVASFVSLLVMLVGLYWINLLYQLNENRNKLMISEMVADKSQVIERKLDFSLMATRMLATQIRLDRGSTERFEDYAPEILNTVQGVANIQLAPDGIITHIYPLAGNEKAIGHNILQDDQRRAEARKAIMTGKMTMAGPFDLVQGGVAVIGRQPIFISTGDGSSFWGFASALIYLEDLLQTANLKTMEGNGYSYQLSHNLRPDGKATVFARSESPLDDRHFIAEIQVPNGSWTLTVSRQPRDNNSEYRMTLALLFMVVVATFALTLHLMRQPERLRCQVEEATEQLREMAFYDPLTGLANRSLLFEHTQSLLNELQRQPETAALLYLDLDNFKTVNDNLGHDAGDELLRHFGACMRTQIRESDIPARIGGDEFCILIKKLQRKEDAAMVASKLISSVAIPVPGITDRYPVTVSVGIVLIPQHADNLQEIFKNADQAMYQAKHNGKNGYSFYQPGPA